MTQQQSQPTANWHEDIAPEYSYRSIFKWGHQDTFEHPNRRLLSYLKKFFQLDDHHFQQSQNLGLETVRVDQNVKLDKAQLVALSNIVGKENIKTDDYSRLNAAYGKSMLDILRLRNKIIVNLPDAIVLPRHKEDIVKIIGYCQEQKIAVYVQGGRSSLCQSTETTNAGIVLDMTVYMNKILAINETNQTVTVQSGILGHKLEDQLNDAVNTLQSKYNYSCGHLPQSLQFSTVGGWIAAASSGQQSSYYGDMRQLVVCQEYITPIGLIQTKAFTVEAAGPSIDQIMMGSEGSFGVLVAATIKIFKYQPENRKKFSYIFHNFAEATQAVRQISQCECGMPAVLRLCDPDETNIILKIYGIEGTLVERYLRMRGYHKDQRCLLMGHSEGEQSIAHRIKKKIHRISKKQGAIYSTGFLTDNWLRGRLRDPYMRDSLLDYGIIVDSLETSVSWENAATVYDQVSEFIKKRPSTICMAHLGHFYAQGSNLCFIFVAKMDSIAEYKKFHSAIIDQILAAGGSLGHHHGIGKMLAPWFEDYLGKNELNLLRAIKHYFDPQNIMNPGGNLALDFIPSKDQYIQPNTSQKLKRSVSAGPRKARTKSKTTRTTKRASSTKNELSSTKPHVNQKKDSN